MKAIILSAGQGRRLLPLTADRPKCLLPISGQTVLVWQLRALQRAGVDLASIVIGFGAAQVEEQLARVSLAGMQTRTILNPIYDRTDNLVSCLAARAEMDEDFLLVNGDTLLEPGVIERLLASEPAPVSVAVVRKASYDADDMKVSGSAGRLTRIGKDLGSSEIDGEAIGVSLYRGEGPRVFLEALEEVQREPDGHRRWYLSAVDRLARRGLVSATLVDGLGYAEIDYPDDVARAENLVAAWGDRFEKLRA
ncbi:MAG: phosphocholine cytidylyltransferase family protein [Deltaproteobacteria bacterium]|nr:phosphocholine cytidylyltransferase family protein [Deltaproteobacteria bacterium]